MLLENQYHFLDHVYLGCTQCECKSNENIVEEYKKMFESRNSDGATEKITWVGKNITQNSRFGLTTWKVMRKGAWKDIVNWPVRRLNSCMYLARIGGPDILWSVNKRARDVTTWTRACDKRLARLIPYIHHTSDYRQYEKHGSALSIPRLRFRWTH